MNLAKKWTIKITWWIDHHFEWLANIKYIVHAVFNHPISMAFIGLVGMGDRKIFYAFESELY